MNRGISLMMLVLLSPLLLTANEAVVDMKPEDQILTRNQAIAAVRSKVKPGDSIHVLRQIVATDRTRKVAQDASRDAQLRHVELYGGGIFIDVLRGGAFLIADLRANKVSALFLVSVSPDGRAVVDSYESQGTVRLGQAEGLAANVVAFSTALLSTAPAEMSAVKAKFQNNHFPEFSEEGQESFFAIPSTIRKIGANESEYEGLAALSGDFQLWPVRYAMALPIYAANPSWAVSEGRKRREALTAEFLARKGKTPQFEYDLQAIGSLKSAQELRMRVSWFKDLDDFLENVFQERATTGTFEANVMVSSIAVQIGSVGSGGQNSYIVMTPPGLLTYWVQELSGRLAVTRVSLSEQ